MDMQGYSIGYAEKSRKKHRRIVGGVIIALIILVCIYVVGILTSEGAEYQMRATAIEENHILKEQVAELEERVAELEAELEKAQSVPSETPASESPETPRD